MCPIFPVDFEPAHRQHKAMIPVRKLRLYLETTVWNSYFADDAPQRRDVTRELFDHVKDGRFDAYTSDLVLEEIAAAPEPRRQQLLDLINRVKPTMLKADEQVSALGEEYVRNGMVPARYRTDAEHIAVAVVNDMDGVVSWNFQHIVRLKTRRLVSAVSRMVAYREIEISTPEEVIGDV